jgi:hypothetical protein
VERPVHPVFPLTLIGKVVAVAAQGEAPRSVKHRYPPTASRTWTDEPLPLSSEVAGRPGERYRFLNVFPLVAGIAPAPVGQHYPFRPPISLHNDPYGAGFSTGP